MVHSCLRPREKIAQFMLMSAAALLILGSFGPWGIEEVSTRSQYNRLQALLEEKKILINNSIQKDHPSISDQEAYEITSRLAYVLQRGKAARLKEWFGPDVQKTELNSASAEDFAKLMGIPYNYFKPTS
ncbi:MAG: hypothetical protein WCG04_03375 [Alphaproteobacteria bacterium]